MFAVVLACCSTALGQDDGTVGPERPSFSTNAHIVPAGRVQLEGGASQQRFGDIKGFDAGELLLRVGVSSRVELRAGLPSYVDTKAGGVQSTGADDAAIEGKVLVKSGDKGAVSVLASTTLPTGTRRIAEHTYQPGGTLISDVNISKKIVVTTNVGYFRISLAGDRHDLTFAVSTLNFALKRSINIYSEFYAQNLRHTYIHRYAATGGKWTIRNQTAIDLSCGFGIGNHAHGPDYYYSIGISRLF